MNAHAPSHPTLPLWVRAAFWSVVAIEWVTTLALATFIVVALVQVGMLFSCLPDSTLYAPGYSESGWVAVRPGDTQATVTARLGAPLHRWSHGDAEWWSYSQQRSGADNYEKRQVQFGIHGVVKEKQESCCID